MKAMISRSAGTATATGAANPTTMSATMAPGTRYCGTRESQTTRPRERSATAVRRADSSLVRGAGAVRAAGLRAEPGGRRVCGRGAPERFDVGLRLPLATQTP